MKRYQEVSYTQEFIERALFELTSRLEKAEDERKEINAEIRRIKKNIQYYEELDTRQLRIDLE